MAAPNGTPSNSLVDIEKPPSSIFLNNEFVQGQGDVLPLFNPKDGKKIPVEVRAATEEDVDKAVRNAREAFETGPWSKWTGEQRMKALTKLADLVDENGPAIAYLESLCSGRPLSMLLGEIPRVSSTFRYYAGWADKLKGDSYPAEDGFYKIVRKEPLGVCCGITAWNASLMFCSWKSGPALATGNTVIMKPSEKSFLGTLAIASLVQAAGFPPGVFQVLVGDGKVGSLLSSHMDIDKISFTGSTATGKRIQDAATKSNLKRVTLELGGKSPALVFDDADLDKALFWVTLGITVNTGQVCAATSRLFVQKSIADAFLEKVKASLGAMSQALGGDPQDTATHYGPVVDAQQFQKVTDFINEGKKRTKVLTGGQEYQKEGYYIAPTVFLDPEPDEKIWREEIFGPVLCVKTFETEEEAIQLANDTQYGLSSAIFTSDIARALRLASSVRTGTVNVNCNLMVGNQAPMGGFRSSGVGRELGEYGLAQYTETKTIWIR
ncbi:hypothetical protein A1O3_03235 [Capronia epimyces CBS 606.96]|uniref:aldehyde dehydrogenase (NAD(+)) n=1 Tax=Capronia epimyces CBS 606.96 TaxID=1182542 RepID=W9YLP3_9EURO|nr:uncharacterized protein A1O3_03235 [Capronia epimyces CBS 606.96]EXJ90166.1 hypothetical protein A1O3_03235 [Capronia epimyces CBS 606.96]